MRATALLAAVTLVGLMSGALEHSPAPVMLRSRHTLEVRVYDLSVGSRDPAVPKKEVCGFPPVHRMVPSYPLLLQEALPATRGRGTHAAVRCLVSSCCEPGAAGLAHWTLTTT